MGTGKFSNSDHLLLLREERCDKKIRDDVKNSKLKELVKYIDVNNRRLILHAKIRGAWKNVQVNTINGTVLAAT